MSSILSIAASGLFAATQRLQVAAENIANANSDGPTASASPAIQAQYPPAYVPGQVNQVATAGGGTSSVVSNVVPGDGTASDPTAPYADASGQVAVPNVDYTNEAIQLVTARYDFAMNAQVMGAYSQLTQTLLDIET
jgi:flagellar basal-body rod protein FlgC